MKFWNRKLFGTILGVGALGCLIAGGGLFAKSVVADADTPKNGPVQVTCKNALGKDATITVEYKNGTYYLADFTRNLYVFDTTNIPEDYDFYGDLHLYLHNRAQQRQISVFSCGDGNFQDPVAVSVFQNLVAAYDFYCEENIGTDWRGVNGKNDKTWNNGYMSTTEFPIYAYVHYNVYPEDSNNASFNRWDEQNFLPSIILIGDGTDDDTNGWKMDKQGKALDVLAHEYQHGVTRFAGKNLVNLGESGAINEAISDVFGWLNYVKTNHLDLSQDETWVYGKDATKDQTPLRNFVNPEKVNENYASTYANRNICDHAGKDHSGGECDNGYIHYNCTILTHLQYSVYKKAPEAFTVESMGKLWWEVLKNLSAQPTLMDFVQAYRTAAYELGFSESAQRAIDEELAASGFEKLYRVDFQDRSGSIVTSSFLQKGESAHAPEIPQQEKEGGYRYEFQEWDKEFSNVTQDLVVKPRYRETRYYSVKFLNESGNVLSEQEVDEGKSAAAPSNPQKAKTETQRFEFEGWSESFDRVTKDLTITPKFRAINYYVVTFVREDGTEISKVQADEGESVSAPEPPEKQSTEQYSYQFKNWSESLDNIRSNLTVRPVYEETIRKYAVKYFVDGKEKTAELEYGATLDSILPQNSDGWFTDEACSVPFNGTVTGNLTLYAKTGSSAGLFIGIGVGAGVVLIAGVGLTVFLLKKKKRSE